jgi:hypothetical protein
MPAVTRIFTARTVRQDKVELRPRQQPQDRIFNLCGR